LEPFECAQNLYQSAITYALLSENKELAGRLFRDVRREFGVQWHNPWQLPLTSEKPGGGFNPALKSKPVWDATVFPSTALLERYTNTFAKEVHLLEASGRFETEEINLVRNFNERDWGTAFLLSRDNPKRDAANCAIAPESCKAAHHLDQLLPSMVSGVKIFRLMPGATVYPHHGTTNSRLSCLLGVDVPPGSLFRLAGRKVNLKNGRVFCFDDTYLHEAGLEAQAPRPRYVLSVRITHPQLWPQSLLDAHPRLAAAATAVDASKSTKNEHKSDKNGGVDL